jgi:hypothetical protein
LDILTFISKIVSALSWPFVVILIVIILRNPLQKLIHDLGRRLHSVKFPGGEAEFSEELAEVKQAADEAQLPQEPPLLQLESDAQRWARLTEISPRSAIIEAWRQVEIAMRESARRVGIPDEQTRSAMALTRALGKHEAINPDIIAIISELRSIRNTAAHGIDVNISQSDVAQYLSLANRVVAQLRS